jgi:hypothetical protein
MSRKLKLDTAALALALLFLAASPAAAQIRRLEASRIPAESRARPATLGCCKCLGGTNTLDLSTVGSNAWTVNGGPAVFLTSIHPAWNINPGPASWVSTVAGGGTGGVPAGVFEYRLDFVVPACTIGQDVTLAGNYGADNDVAVFLDDATGPASGANAFFVSQCTGSWCFNSSRNPLPSFVNKPVAPGPHTLIVKVRNEGGPSGMFVNATLTGACRRE